MWCCASALFTAWGTYNYDVLFELYIVDSETRAIVDWPRMPRWTSVRAGVADMHAHINNRLSGFGEHCFQLGSRQSRRRHGHSK